jgi:hypothetical protein
VSSPAKAGDPVTPAMLRSTGFPLRGNGTRRVGERGTGSISPEPALVRAIEHSPTFVRDTDASNMDPLASCFHGRRPCRREPVADKVKQFDGESCKKQGINAAVRSRCGEQFKYAALAAIH